MDKEVRLMTPGVLAERLGVPLPRVLYLLRTRPDVRHVARAGTLRLYDKAALSSLRAALTGAPPAQRGGGADGK
jgi:hypothetical protein